MPLLSIEQQDVDQDDEEGKDKAKQEPDINILDVGGEREARGHSDIESSEYHHARDVHCDDGFCIGCPKAS